MYEQYPAVYATAIALAIVVAAVAQAAMVTNA